MGDLDVALLLLLRVPVVLVAQDGLSLERHGVPLVVEADDLVQVARQDRAAPAQAHGQATADREGDAGNEADLGVGPLATQI